MEKQEKVKKFEELAGSAISSGEDIRDLIDMTIREEKIFKSSVYLDKRISMEVFMNTNNVHSDWINDLSNYQFIYLSFIPDYPQFETKYELIKHEIMSTELGALLILNLKDNETGDNKVFSIPDIDKVELNESSTKDFRKYYLHCIVRPNYYKLLELNQRKEMGIPVDDEKRLTLLESQYMTYRVSLSNA